MGEVATSGGTTSEGATSEEATTRRGGAICCRVLRHVVLCHELWQCVSARHSALQHVAISCCVLQCVEMYCNLARQWLAVEQARSVLQSATAC